MKIINVAKAIVLNHEDQILLLQRSKSDDRRPGEWDFPGGWVEEGEGFAAGCAREITEEAGLAVQPSKLKLVYTATTAYDDLSVNRFLFVTRIGQAEISLSREHDNYRWVKIDAALKDFQHPFYNSGLKYAFEHDLL